MRVCYIYRKPLNGRHSMENVFHTVSNDLEKKGVEIINVFCQENLFKTLKILCKIKADVFHITGDIHYLSLFLPRNKTLLTIHDIGAYKNKKKTIKQFIYFLIWFFLPVHFLKKITVVSQLTANDIIKYTRLKPGKIAIIENPITIEESFNPKKTNSKLRILQIGTGAHKNLKNLILAVKDVECELVIVGKPAKEEVKLMAEFNLDYHLYYSISKEKLLKIYKEIDLLFFASFSEGFGLPILEAQKIGRPVVTSDISPMKEVSGGFAFLVNPNSPEDIKEAIFKIKEQNMDVRKILQGGRSNVEKYAASTISKKYLSLYKSLIYS